MFRIIVVLDTKGSIRKEEKMYPNLNAELARNNINLSELADLLKITRSTLSDKLNGKTDFKITECKMIQQQLPNATLDYLFEIKETKKRD